MTKRLKFLSSSLKKMRNSISLECRHVSKKSLRQQHSNIAKKICQSNCEVKWQTSVWPSLTSDWPQNFCMAYMKRKLSTLRISNHVTAFICSVRLGFGKQSPIHLYSYNDQGNNYDHAKYDDACKNNTASFKDISFLCDWLFSNKSVMYVFCSESLSYFNRNYSPKSCMALVLHIVQFSILQALCNPFNYKKWGYLSSL